MTASGEPAAAISEAMSWEPALSEIRYEDAPGVLWEALDMDETVESIDVVRGMVAGGSCREGLDEVDILGEDGGELVNETPLRNGSLVVLRVAIGRECACACEAAAPFSAISSFSASAAAASRISSSRGSGAARLAGLGTRTRSRK
jgi:hypothetical protein